MLRWLVILLACGAVVPAHAQEIDLDALAARAGELEPSPPRYIENVKFGLRGVTFLHMAVVTSDPDVMYVTSFDGYIFGTQDGGRSWSEGRLITQRSSFFGAIRPARPPGITGEGGPASALDLRPSLDFGLARRKTAIFEDTIRGNYSSYPPDSVAQLPGLADTARVTIDDELEAGAGGGGDAARFGVGITATAPRLQALLKKRGARLVGLNLKLLLNLRGVEWTWVNHVAVHPSDPKHVLAATAQGLFISRDGGLGWDHVFSGRNASERWCNFVTFDPADPSRILLGTEQGLLISTDQGEKFASVTGTQLSDSPTHWLAFAPTDPRVIYAGSRIGAFRSDDGGNTWRWIFFETLPTANHVTGIAVHPQDPDKVVLATKDGLFRSVDGGDTWAVAGGFLFTSNPVYRVIADPNDGDHLVCSDKRRVWESFDGGVNWNALYINDSDWQPRDLMFDPHREGVFWILTSGELLKLSSTPPSPPDPQRLRALKERLRSEPTLPATMDAAFRTADVHRGERSLTRANARLASFLPTIDVVGGYTSATGFANLGDFELQAVTGGPTVSVGGVPFNRGAAPFPKTLFGDHGYVFVSLSWALPSTVFHLEEAPYGRYFSTANRYYLKIKYEVQRLYEERRRVLIELATLPPDDVRSRLFLRLRLEELTAHLDALTNGLYRGSVEALEREGWIPAEGLSSPGGATRHQNRPSARTTRTPGR